MKCFFSFVFILFVSQPILADVFEANYKIKVKGVTIGKVSWDLKILNDKYEINVGLDSHKLLSKIYGFSGNYKTTGKKINGKLYPEKYNQAWKTKKKSRDIELVFKNKKIKKIFINPVETEHPRINYLELLNYNDPLTSFSNIFLFGAPSLTIDGRRTYMLTPKREGSYFKISVDNYKNIWADHKRNDLEYLEIFQTKKQSLPEKIKIGFDGFLFLLIKD